MVSAHKESIFLEWSIPSPPPLTPESLTVTGFEICLISEQSQCVHVNKSDINYFTWRNLTPSTPYNITIQALIGEKRGAKSEMIQVTTAAEGEKNRKFTN